MFDGAGKRPSPLLGFEMLGFLRRLLGKRDAGLPVSSIYFLHELQGYDGPLYVHAIRERGGGLCERGANGRFVVTREGSFSNINTGRDFILVSKALAKVLQASCGHCAEFLPAEVIDRTTGKVVSKQVEVRPRDEITPQTAELVDASGAHLWHWMHGALFVTKTVMLALQAAGFDLLEFERGFQFFCGEHARKPVSDTNAT